MSLHDYQSKASKDKSRCVEKLDKNEAMLELDAARRDGLIDFETYNWSEANEYYPVTDIDGKKIIAICTWGCFEKQTKLLSTDSNGNESWIEAAQVTIESTLASLASSDLESAPQLFDRGIVRISEGEEKNPLIVFHLDNGRNLKVTQNHGMLLSNGRMVAAKNVSPSDGFLDYMTGERVPISSIGSEPTSNQVYNFRTSAIDKIGHIIVAEGVLVGDLAWQNELAGDLEAILLRK